METQIEEKGIDAAKALETETSAIVVRAQEVGAAIVDQASYERAAALYNQIGAKKKEVEEYFREPREKAHAAWKSLTEKIKGLIDPLSAAEKALKPKMGVYLQEQERLRLEEQKRQQKEAQARLDAQKLEEAQELEDAGQVQEAEAVLQTQVVAAAPKIEAPKVAGMCGGRESWKAQVFSMRDLCRAVAEGKVAANLVMPNQPVLDTMARVLKAEMKIPGVKPTMEIVPVRG